MVKIRGKKPKEIKTLNMDDNIQWTEAQIGKTSK